MNWRKGTARMNIKFFDLAKKVSKLSDHKNFHIGCVIVRGSRIVSVGTNKVKTHPKSRHPFFSLHGEMAAILLAKQDLKGCEMYVFRAIKNGTWALSRPCKYCWELISESGIKKVHYTTDNGHCAENINA
jgi:deoxycytidylate deaminase